jgi:phospholipase/carboxylesterase
MNTPLVHRAIGAPDAASRLLVLVHGVGGNETNLVPLGETVADADTLVVFPRAPLTLGPGQYAWFPVRFGPNGPEMDFEQAQRSNRVLQEFIAGLQAQHHIAAEDTVIAGFSQGGIMSASVGLTAPERVAGFAVLAGRILPEIEPFAGPAEALRKLDALVVHGRRDDKLPVAWAERADAMLERLGVPHEVVLHDGGHDVPPEAQRAFAEWWAR